MSAADVVIPLELPEEVNEWMVDDVTTFLEGDQACHRLADRHIKAIKDEELCGRHFDDLTVARLQYIVFGVGPARRIVGIIEGLDRPGK